ncbi:MAG: hypothetical protein IJV72_02295 [Clostridia bacterium]|nr:hypothetical protein [Clostridia bacterium]
MIRDRKRIARTFIKYGRLGLASSGLDVLDIYARIKGSSRTREEAYRLLAVCDTVRFLKISGKEEALGAVQEIYFPTRGTEYSKSEISGRVIRYSQRHNCDERTVYRRLAYAISVYEAVLESYK